MNKRQQIELNDPALTKLIIIPFHYCSGGRDAYASPDGDWGRDGKGVGRNAHIKELIFSTDLRIQNVSRDDINAFCRGLAGNESIQRLELCCCELFDGEIVSMLNPFFERNNNLRSLCVKKSGNVQGQGMFFRNTRAAASNNIRLISDSLSRFDTLQEFEYQSCSLIESVEMIIQALAGHSGMTKIILGGNNVGGRGAAAMAALLANSNSSLEWLNLSSCFLDDRGADILAAALGRNAMLKKLILDGNPDITITGGLFRLHCRTLTQR